MTLFLGRMLAQRIRTGIYRCNRPDPNFPVEWQSALTPSALARLLDRNASHDRERAANFWRRRWMDQHVSACRAISSSTMPSWADQIWHSPSGISRSISVFRLDPRRRWKIRHFVTPDCTCTGTFTAPDYEGQKQRGNFARGGASR